MNNGMTQLGCLGYVGDACGACGDGYALAGSLCQRTMESFQVQAALAGKPTELPPAPAPGPATSLGPKVLYGFFHLQMQILPHAAAVGRVHSPDATPAWLLNRG